MAIGIGFETDQDIDMRTYDLFHFACVIGDGAQIDLYPGWPFRTCHDYLLPAGRLTHQLLCGQSGLRHEQFRHALHTCSF